MRATIGRTRRTVANKLYKSADRARVKGREITTKLDTPGEVVHVQNKEVRNRILRTEAPKAKTTVSFRAHEATDGGRGGTMISGDTIRSLPSEARLLVDLEKPSGDTKLFKKLYDKGDKYASAVAVPPNAGVDTLAHELGHAQGRVSGGIRGYISRTDPRNDPRNNEQLFRSYKPANRSQIMSSGGKRVGFRDALRDTVSNIRNSGHVIAEETAATRSGLQMLKRHGASREEIARAGEYLRLAGSTYRQAGKASVLSSLGRLVDIPSRRQI